MSTLHLSPTYRSTGRAVPARVVPVRAVPQGSVRLTRRGRLVVLLAALALVLGAAFFLASGAAGTDEAGEPPATEIVLVGPGDTLWGIASEITEDGDVRSMMSEIQHLNAMDSAGLQSGQKLRVPVASE